jgi:hypothetical protein
VGDEIKISGDDDKLKQEATDAANRLNLSQFVKDMVLQLLVKGDAVGFKRYAQSGRDIDELVCVNPVSIKVKYAQGELYVNDTPAAWLAYKLIKRGIISQVSIECDYQEGECSICKKRFTNKADYCPHLRKFKGRE